MFEGFAANFSYVPTILENNDGTVFFSINMNKQIPKMQFIEMLKVKHQYEDRHNGISKWQMPYFFSIF